MSLIFGRVFDDISDVRGDGDGGGAGGVGVGVGGGRRDERGGPQHVPSAVASTQMSVEGKER